MRFDVAVIGAGAAGLMAARRIAEAGLSVVLLEGRDRVGGRVFTVDGVELGAEFVHGTPGSTLTLAREAGLRILGTGGEHWVGTGGLLTREGDPFANLDRLIEMARRLPHDVPAAEFLAQFRDDPHLSSAALWARRLAEGFDAADTGRASLKTLIEEWGSDAGVGSPQRRIQHGYGALIAHLTDRLPPSVDLRLEHRVTAIEWAGQPCSIEVEAKGQPDRFEARAVVLTLPLGVLQASAGDIGAVRFTPALSAKHAALEGLVMGAVLKVVLRFRDRFWTRLSRGKYRKAGFFFRMTGHFPTFWSSFPEKQSILNAWYGGPGAALLSQEASDVIIAEAVESLQVIFGSSVSVRQELEKGRVYNWQSDRYSLGGYSYVAVNGNGSRTALAQPIAGKLFFAGEATDDKGEACTVAGALSSGERVAGEVQAALS